MKFQPVSTPGSTIDLTQGNGLPYWIFWFLVCVIFLLMVFIFLRDRDLRKKLDSFFFGARKKFSKLRLQVQIRLEEKKKEFTRTLRARLNQQKEVENKKRSLEEKMELLEKKKKTVDEVEIKKKDIQSRIVRNDQEKGKLLRRYDKLQEEMKPLFISLGEILEGKIKNEDSMMLYAHQLERINKNLLEMKKQLKEL